MSLLTGIVYLQVCFFSESYEGRNWILLVREYIPQYSVNQWLFIKWALNKWYSLWGRGLQILSKRCVCVLEQEWEDVEEQEEGIGWNPNADFWENEILFYLNARKYTCFTHVLGAKIYLMSKEKEWETIHPNYCLFLLVSATTTSFLKVSGSIPLQLSLSVLQSSSYTARSHPSPVSIHTSFDLIKCPICGLPEDLNYQLALTWKVFPYSFSLVLVSPSQEQWLISL